MRIGIVGAGAVGSYFGARLAHAGEEVVFIARGAHLAAMQKQGLVVHSPLGDVHLPHVHATSDTASVGPVDIVFSTVKMYDAAGVVPIIRPLMGPHTIVIPVQNGVESVDILRQAFPAAQVAGGTAHVAALITEPGVVTHTALNRLIFGMPDGSPSPLLDALSEAGNRAGFEAKHSNRIDGEIWAKFIRLTVFSGMTSICRTSIGPIREDADLWAMMGAAWQESVDVAEARGISGLPPKIRSQMPETFGALPAGARSSMLEDLERGRQLELPWLSGAMVRIAGELNVDVPTHRLFVTLLRIHAHGATAATKA